MNKICIECGKEFNAKRSNSLYCYDKHVATCVICGNSFEYSCSPKDKPKTCSKKCKNLYKISNLQEKYGENITSVSQLDSVKAKKRDKQEASLEKSRQTCLARYGVDSVSKVREIVDKQQLSRSSEECKQRTRQTYQERYGVDHLFSDPEFRELHCNNVDHNRQKAIATLKSKYQVDEEIHSPMNIPEIVEKAKSSYNQTVQDNYDGVRPCQTNEVREKISKGVINAESSIVKNNQAKYQVDYPQQLPEIAKKISDAISDPEYQKQFRAKSIEHFGVPHPMQSPEVQEKHRQVFIEKYGVPYLMQSPEFKDKMKETFNDKYGVEWPWFMNSSKDSKTNQHFREMLNAAGIECSKEFNIDDNYYDVAIHHSNILIEIDPTYTHNAIGNHWSAIGLPPNYHLNKSAMAESKGYRCIHVFDWDDKNKIIKMLSNKKRVYARQCIMQEVDEKTCNSFLTEFHLQSGCRGQIVRYGLYYNNELIQVMTFGKPRYTKKYEWELLRLCTRSDFNVIGGASKLFKNFIEKMNPQSIISYCDRSKFSGSVYYQIGMKLDHISAPARVWSKSNNIITDNLLRQRGYDQLFNTNFGKGTSNDELMISSGWLPVYDCGQMIFTYNK